MPDLFVGDKESFKPFKGKLRKISMEIQLNLMLDNPNDGGVELEQHLTLNDRGRVWFSAYGFKNLEYKKLRKENFSVDKKGTNFLFDLLEKFFSVAHEMPVVLDGDYCFIELTNTDDEKFVYAVFLCDEYIQDNYNLSDVFRDVIGRTDFYAFDGKARFHIVDKIVLDFTRVKKFLPNAPKGFKADYVTWNYKEQIVIDRKDHSFAQYVVIGKGCKIAHEYYVEGGIENLLDSFDGDNLFRIVPKTPDNVINNPDDISLYRITVGYRNESEYMVEGVFDQYGLPEDYDMFVTALLKFMGFYNFGLGETLLKLNYNKKRRCEGQYIYLTCIFEEHGKTYFYRTEDDTIDINDFLIVEAGSDNHKAIVKVVGVEYYDEDSVPFPVSKTRSILRRAEESDFED